MYKAALIRTPDAQIKLTRPKLQSVYPRKRLFDILSEYIHSSALWICGPAGSGKTTLVNSFLHHTNIPCIWYDVDETDTDIASFFYYMGKASEQISPEKSSYLPLLTQEFFPSIPVFTKRYFEIFSRLFSFPFVLVLDNYQTAGENSLLHEVLCSAIDTLQQNISFIICSRGEPPAELARPRANCKLQLIGWHHLQLQKNETEGIIECINGTPYPQEIVSDIHQKIDGWVAALLLLLKRGEFENIEPHMLTAHTPEEIFDYLGSIIFEHFEHEIQIILLKLCHLSKISLSAAETLGGERAPGILKILNKQNAFTYRSMGDSPEYHFHPLFREFLQKRAEGYFPLRELQRLQSQSAFILAKEKKIEEAVILYIKSSHPMEAIELILAQAPILSAQGRILTLEKWINALPQKIVSQTPWLIFWKGACTIPISPVQGKSFFQKALNMFEQVPDPAGCYISLSGILDAITYQFNDFSELDPYLEKYYFLEKCFGKIESPEIRLKLTSSMLNALVMRQPNSKETGRWIERGWEMLHMVKDVNITVQIFMPLIILKIMQGDLSAADHILKMFQEVSHKKASPLSYLVLEDLKSFHAWLSGNFEEGLSAARRGMAVEKETGINLIFLGFRTHGAASAMGLGKLDLARKLLEEITPFLDREGMWMQGLYHYIFSWLHLLSGNPADYRFHALACLEKEKKAGNGMVMGGCNLMMAKMLYAAGKKQEAGNYLNKSLEVCNQYGCIQDKFMAKLTQAIFFLDDHQDAEADKALRNAFHIGRERNYTYSFLWHPQEMARLCAEALKRDIEVPYVRTLIQKHNLITKDPPLDIPNWPWHVSIFALGEFTIKIRGKELKFSRKAQQRPLSMLKYLMARGGQKVPEYGIQDLLWPESDGDSAHNAYTTTLHRLRKMLGDRGSLVHTEGHLSFNNHIVWTDTMAFEACCRRIEVWFKKKNSMESTTMDTKDISRLLNDLFSLYRGSFLPGEQSSWAIPQRERLKSKFLSTLQKIGDVLENLGEWSDAINCYKKAIEIEPLLEYLHQQIMQIYVRMKKKSEALCVYRQYEAIFRAELGVPPSQRMKHLKNSLF